MSSPDLVVLRSPTASGEVEVAVAVAAGGRVAQVHVDGQPLLVDAPRPATPTTGWGSFPMAPWAGRIRHGRFRFLGEDHQLECNVDDGSGDEHAIHGTVFSRPWTVDDHEIDSLRLHCDLAGELGWPFGGRAHQRLQLSATELRCELTVEATDAPFPGELGWHPWFRKPARLEFHPLAMYRRAAPGLPTGELVSPGEGPWDDCFVNTAPVVLRYARELVPTITLTSDCDHWVVYDEPSDATCVEPQSGPPDAVHVRPRVVAPGRPLTRTMSIRW